MFPNFRNTLPLDAEPAGYRFLAHYCRRLGFLARHPGQSQRLTYRTRPT